MGRFSGSFFSNAWEQRKLGDIGKTYTGLSGKSAKDFGHGDGKYVTYMNVFINPIAKPDVVESIEIDNKQNQVKKGDIFFTTSSETPHEVGMSSVWLCDDDNIYLNSFCFGYRPSIENDSNFFGYMLRSSKVRDDITLLAQGISRFNISKTKMMENQVNLPTLEEQSKIGEFFRSLDNLITLHQRKYEKLQNIKKALLCKLFPEDGFVISRLRFKSFNQNWEQYKLDEFGLATSGTSIESEFTNDGQYKVISIGSYAETSTYTDQGLRTRLTEKTKSRILDRDDLTMILNDKTASGKIIGRVLLIEKANTYVFNQRTQRIQIDKELFNPGFIYQILNSQYYRDKIIKQSQGNTQIYVNWSIIKETKYLLPNLKEQEQIGNFFKSIDNLITLYQRKYEKKESEKKMSKKHILFVDYYEQWIMLYKKGAVREVTMKKYLLTLLWLKKLIPNLKTEELTRIEYQQLLNNYAKTHEKQTTMDFHHQLKGAIADAVDEGVIDKDPTRKAIIKGKQPREKKDKFLNQFQLKTLLSNLNLDNKISNEWLILLIAKTGVRFSEALGLTPTDFDFTNQSISINKTWDYKNGGGFQDTKNSSSKRKVKVDWQIMNQFNTLLKDQDREKPIFIQNKMYNSTINHILKKYCIKSKIPVITIHGLRHTHASLLLFSGVSIASVAMRLGHSDMTTTQKTYLHIVQELENKDVDQVMRLLSSLG